MNAVDFKKLLVKRADKDLLGPCLRDSITPYVFDPMPTSWSDFRAEVKTGLSMDDADDLTVVGSGRFGFSLKPGTNLRPFSDRSDVDLVVISARLFDRLWHDLLSAAYPRPPLEQRLGGWLQECRRGVYTGWLVPPDIHLDRRIVGNSAQPVLEFKALWFETLKRSSRHLKRKHEDIKGRLYRTWTHAELYHLHSIAALRRTLAS